MGYIIIADTQDLFHIRTKYGKKRIKLYSHKIQPDAEGINLCGLASEQKSHHTDSTNFHNSD